MALRVALDLDVYNTLSSDDGSPKSAAQLAEPKGADPVLVGGCWFLSMHLRAIMLWDQKTDDLFTTARMMRHLSAMSSVREVARDQYVHSKYSRELTRNPAMDAFKYMYVRASERSNPQCLPNSARDFGVRSTDVHPPLSGPTTTTKYGRPPPPGSPPAPGKIHPTPATRLPPRLGTLPIPLSSNTWRRTLSRASDSAP